MEFVEQKRIWLNPFWLSIFLHILLLLLFSLAVILTKDETKKAPEALPAYILPDKKVPPRVERQRARKHSAADRVTNKKQAELTPNADRADFSATDAQAKSPGQSILASSLKMLDRELMKEVTSSMEETEPMYLLGEETAYADPFLMLLGKALSAHFAYPKAAGALGIRGRVLVSFMIHPDGYFSNVRIVQSSHNHDLDAAALYAVNQAPLIPEMKRFLKEPKHFVVGFIFR